MSSDEIIEIGPGDGALSYIISKDVKKLILIEKDTDLISELKNGFKNADNVVVKNEDILKLELLETYPIISLLKFCLSYLKYQIM